MRRCAGAPISLKNSSSSAAISPRPAIANERLKRNRAGQVVLQLKSPYKDGTTHIVMEPLEFMERLAEDIAVVDVISGGRFELGAGVGYKREEFDSFGVPFKELRGAHRRNSRDRTPTS